MQAPLSGSVPDWLRQRAATTPARLALVVGDARLTFSELDEAVDATAAAMAGAGIRRGDLVPLLSGSTVNYVRAVHATARLGAVLMPLNTRLSPAEACWQLQDVGVSRLIADQANMNSAKAVGKQSSGLQLLSLEDLMAPTLPVRPESVEGRTPRLAKEVARFDLSSLHSVVYTSGTSGRPKGAMLTYGNHLWSAIASSLNLGLVAKDCWLAAMPLFHVGGLSILLRSVIYGIPCIVHETFDPESANRAIDEEGVTIMSVVANMLQRMLDLRAGRPYPQSFRCMLLGGGPAPQPLLERAAALGVPVVQTYGLTETASQVVTLAPEDALLKLGSAGKPLFGSEIRIANDDGPGAAPGEPGEICVRGPMVTQGYLNHPEYTASALRDGWLHTGDIGYLDVEGYLYVLDRRDDLIVSGGENVYPAEIEAALQAHPAVVEAGVFGVEDELWGRVPVAVVVLREPGGTTADDLLAFCGERLARYKVPKRIEFVRALPRNAARKLLRRELSKIRAGDLP